MALGERDPIIADALETLIGDHDVGSRQTALHAIFHRDPLRAYDHLAPFFARDDIGSRAVATSTLELVAQSGPSPLVEQDPRWLALCAELCQSDDYGAPESDVSRYAKLVLSSPERESTLAVLEAVQGKRAPRPVAVRQARGDLVARYRAGDRLAVWREARAFKAIAGGRREEINALAHETMGRVAYNADLISERLRKAGWVSLGPARSRPAAVDTDIIAAIEDMTGAPLPPSLLAFWRVVGGISLVWDYNQGEEPVIEGLPLAMIDTDALYVAPCKEAKELSFDQWEDEKSVIHPDLVGPFTLDLAPDRLHKINVSGGPAYAIELPFAGADPVFIQEKQESSLPFVDYLRDCFAWAGFPHLKYYEDQPAALRFVNALKAGMEPF